jgi:hypothetical protein
MMKLAVIENSTTGNLQEEHILDVPPCCPVSKNPRPGSTITIRYNPIGKSLEIASLIAYLHSFKGGLYDDSGNLVVRDMEGMLLRISHDCQALLEVPVHVEANLELLPRQKMQLKA